jgi:hypothetical protein
MCSACRLAASSARYGREPGVRAHANQAWWQLLEERQEVAPLQLTADDHLTSGINSVNLEDRLGNVETDCRDRLHG